MSPKIDVARRNFAAMYTKLLCPHCQTDSITTTDEAKNAQLTLNGNSFTCPTGHCYDLSARNYLNLAPAQKQTGQKYNKDLFQARRRVFESGFYRPLIDAILERIPTGTTPDQPLTILDAGCGEGWFAGEICRSLTAHGCPPEILAVDLAKDGVEMAATHCRELKCLIADLTRLPLADASVDVIVNILSPANYNEFRRVLHPGGLLLKVIPGEDYLHQVRTTLGAAPGHASTAATLFDAAASTLDEQQLYYTLPLTPAQAADFLQMSPLSFNNTENIDKIINDIINNRAVNTLSEITIDLTLLVARFN